MFHRIVAVDWSAAASPRLGRDSIWTCEHHVGSGRWRLANHATRAQAEDWMRKLLGRAAGERVLVAVDFPFGYPAGFAAAARLPAGRAWEVTWRYLAAAVTDGPANRSNRFDVAAELNALVSPGPGPFWGCRPDAECATLSARKVARFPHRGLAEHRPAEEVLRRSGRWVSSVWQLWGAGSVGSQALTGIPVLARLRWDEALSARVRVWPFETGWATAPAAELDDAVILAECWPGIVPLDSSLHPVRDAAQVRGLAAHLARRAAGAALGSWFAAPSVADGAQAAVAEEGWILGVPGATVERAARPYPSVGHQSQPAPPPL